MTPSRPTRTARRAPLPSDPRQALRAATDVKRDELGRIVEIVGPDPTTVLVRYCESRPTSPLPEPLEITETVPPSRDRRLGIFRDYAGLQSVYAILIRRDFRSDRWIAGGRGEPLEPMEAPELPEDALRLPVRER